MMALNYELSAKSSKPIAQDPKRYIFNSFKLILSWSDLPKTPLGATKIIRTNFAPSKP